MGVHFDAEYVRHKKNRKSIYIHRTVIFYGDNLYALLWQFLSLFIFQKLVQYGRFSRTEIASENGHRRFLISAHFCIRPHFVSL